MTPVDVVMAWLCGRGIVVMVWAVVAVMRGRVARGGWQAKAKSVPDTARSRMEKRLSFSALKATVFEVGLDWISGCYSASVNRQRCYKAAVFQRTRRPATSRKMARRRPCRLTYEAGL